jgi:hypothetical protein
MEFPKVVAVGKTLLVHQGIQLGVLSVELWEPHVVVQIAGIPLDGSVEEREREFRDKEIAWMRPYSESPDNAPGRPDHPIGADHHSLNVRLSDTISTAYRCIGGGGSGAGWNFTFSHQFAPPVPDDIAALSITFSIEGGTEASTEVALIGGHS